MMPQRRSFFIKMVALTLVMLLMVPSTVHAATIDSAQTYASNYLTAYSAYVYVTNSGQVQVWYEVMGTGDMDEIGVLSIKLYESTDKSTWTRVKTFSHENYSTMLSYNDWYHSSYVAHQGTSGKYYKAYICIWAGKDGNGDTRYMWTSVAS